MRGSHLSIVTHPELLIVEGGDRLRDLQQSLKSIHLCSIDIDHILDHVVECIFEFRSIEDELLHLPSTLLEHEAQHCAARPMDSGMFLEAFDEDVLSMEDISWKAIRVGQELKLQFQRLKLFEEEYLRYQHSRIIGDATIILRRRRR